MNKNWLEVQAKGEKVAKIKIHGVIGGDWYGEGVTDAQVEADLEEVSNIKAETIKVDLDSLGGSVKHGMKIYNMLKGHSANVEIDITGWTASMGTVIAMAADDGKLRMVNNGQFLVHEARTIAMGTKSQLEADAKFLNNINNDIAAIYSERNGISVDDALALMALNGGEGEFWNSEETLEKGFIDETFKPNGSQMAAAVITQEKLKEYKINAKVIMENNENVDNAPVVEATNEINTDSIVKSVVEAVKGLMKKEDKKEVNVEEIVEAKVKEVSDEFSASLEVEKAENKAALDVEVEKYNAVKAELDALKAGSSEPTGEDANVNASENKVLTEADKAAAEFKAQLSDTDKMLMSNKEDK